MTIEKVLLLASGSFAVPTLERLKDSDRELRVGVLPAPSGKRRGRDNELPVRDGVRTWGISHFEIERIDAPETLDAIRDFAPDLGLAIDFGLKVPESVRSIPPHRFWNLHPSLLPKYRGASPVPRAILNGDAETGVTVFELVDRMDAGPILAQKRVTIGEGVETPDLLQRLAKIGADLLMETLVRAERGEAAPAPQSDENATYAKRFRKEDGRVDWNAPADRIERQVRGLKPWPGTWTEWDHPKGKRRLFLRHVRPATPCRTLPPGEICIDKSCGLCVGSAQGALEILRIQQEGKKEMDADEFLRGVPLKDGDRFAG